MFWLDQQLTEISLHSSCSSAGLLIQASVPLLKQSLVSSFRTLRTGSPAKNKEDGTDFYHSAHSRNVPRCKYLTLLSETWSICVKLARTTQSSYETSQDLFTHLFTLLLLFWPSSIMFLNLICFHESLLTFTL